MQYNQVGLKRGRLKGNGKACPKAQPALHSRMGHKACKQTLLSFRFANIPRISFKTQMKSLSLSIQPQMLLSLNSSRNHCTIMAAKDIAWCLAKRSTHHHAHLKAAIGNMSEKGKGKKDITSTCQRKYSNKSWTAKMYNLLGKIESSTAEYLHHRQRIYDKKITRHCIRWLASEWWFIIRGLHAAWAAFL